MLLIFGLDLMVGGYFARIISTVVWCLHEVDFVSPYAMSSIPLLSYRVAQNC